MNKEKLIEKIFNDFYESSIIDDIADYKSNILEDFLSNYDLSKLSKEDKEKLIEDLFVELP